MSSVYCQASMTPKSKPVLFPGDIKVVCRGVPDPYHNVPDILMQFNAGHHGKITVLERNTGYSFAMRDTETGFKDFASPWQNSHCNFWLASGGIDITREIMRRREAGMHWDEAVQWVKRHANMVIGRESETFINKCQEAMNND